MNGRFDATDRLVQILIGLSAMIALANGGYMLFDPFGWYEFVGTVKATGPANAHFIRDIGLAYIGSGLLLTHAAPHPGLRWGSALVGALWLALHGALHIYEVTSGICGPDIFWRDAPGVLGPPFIVFLALAIQLLRQRVSPVPLPKFLFVAMMKRMGDDGEPYIDDLSRAGGFAIEKFQHAMLLVGHRYRAPAALLHMACLGSTRTEDCGPCVEIVRLYALADGLDADRIQNALMGRPVCAEDALAYDFGAAVASGDAMEAAELGDRIEAAFGRHIRTELSLSAASGRLFPAMKRGLGYATACTIAGAR
jgi:hypothetical protein